MGERSTRALAAAALVLASAPAPAAARDEPLWEAGLGVAVLDFPDYRGSSHSRAYVLPAPYVVYRGDLVRADRNGLRGMIFRSDRLDVNLSLGASLPVSSDENTVRQGMPDLKPTFEIGPSFDYTLVRAPDRRWNLDLRLPIRGAISLESSPRYVGTQLTPNVNLDYHDPFGFDGWNLGLVTGAVFTDSRYNQYFYSVPPAYATAERPAFDARGGFGGAEFIVALSKRFPKFWVGGFARYDALQGAKFIDSPLVTSKHYFAAGIAISWILGESKERVAVDRYGEYLK